jgi:hypothetical protein
MPHRLPAASAPFLVDIGTVGFDDDSNFDNEIFRVARAHRHVPTARDLKGNQPKT